MTRKNEDGIVYIIMYVDDFLCVGDERALKKLEEELKGPSSGLTIKVTESLTDYLSCDIKIGDDKMTGYLTQPHLIKNLRKTFGEMVENKQKYCTPGTPGQGVLRPEGEEMKIASEKQKMFRSGAGMLLYLVKHSRSDIANATRELSKSMDGATEVGFQELLRVIKYVLDTEGYGLKLEPKKDTEMWSITAFSDSDWAGDKQSRISVSGYVLYFCGVAVAWKSKGMKHITLSSAEAELVALSECVKDVRFVMKIMEDLKLEVKRPVVVRVDNVGAMFLAENSTTSQRTRHIDIRYKWVSEFIENGDVQIVFVKTAENDADIFTKNVSGDLNERHVRQMMHLEE